MKILAVKNTVGYRYLILFANVCVIMGQRGWMSFWLIIKSKLIFGMGVIN
jgi:hypothetical protein